VVVQCDLRVFNAVHLGTESIDSRVGGYVVLVILCCQTPVDQRNGDLKLDSYIFRFYHVLDAMVSVSRVVKRSLFVDNVNASFLGSDLDVLDII
jgi:hypothetical protein